MVCSYMRFTSCRLLVSNHYLVEVTGCYNLYLSILITGGRHIVTT